MADLDILDPMLAPLLILGLAFSASPSHARGDSAAAPCPAMESWDETMQMCMPLAMEGMSMRMLMLHGQVFGGETVEQGPRGRSAAWSTSMVMADLGTSLGSANYLNLDVMGTAEKWTMPAEGYPELLQIGESDASGHPFIDAQHPHSSPIMGLTLSDTLTFSPDTHLRISAAPRGESTDGPTAFMLDRPAW